MKILHPIRFLSLISIAGMALLVLLTGGCSKPSDAPVVQSPPSNMTDLGAVQLTPGTPQQIDLGSGKSCVVTGSQTRGGILVQVTLSTKNADGSVNQLQMQGVATPGQKCTVSSGDTGVSLTPTLAGQ